MRVAEHFCVNSVARGRPIEAQSRAARGISGTCRGQGSCDAILPFRPLVLPIVFAFGASFLAGCGVESLLHWDGTASASTQVYVIERGSHTDIALPAEALTGALAQIARDFPGARSLVFGFGDRRYVLSRDVDFGDMLAALFPGRAALLVTALKAPPAEAFGARMSWCFICRVRAANASRYSLPDISRSMGAARHGRPGRGFLNTMGVGSSVLMAGLRR